MLLPELKQRRDKIRLLMSQQGIDAALIACNVNLIYTYGAVVSGYLYLPIGSPAMLFYKRPNTIAGENTFAINKPEQIKDILVQQGKPLPKKLMLEADELSYNEYLRLSALFPDSEIVNGTPLIRQERAVKTLFEIEQIRRSAQLHAKCYDMIPQLYRQGMTDLELSVEIERAMRLNGNLGIFRVFGRSMEIFMGSLLVGDNALYPSPYDFALGGQGIDESLPCGLNKTPIKEGNSIMVDMGGNFFGYMCDMTRVYSVGKLSDEAYTAHNVCLEVQSEVSAIAKEGVQAQELYNKAIEVVSKHGFADRFMGSKQQAKFVGHGIGLEINESPVLAPRVKTELEAGMVFALEPKIVIPSVGAVGVENTWLVTKDGVEKLTICNEDIVQIG